jgi:hypothetical protein
MKKLILILTSVLVLTTSSDARVLFTQNKLQCVLQQATVSGTLHIATVDGGAMFFHDSIDFSSYAGNDTDSTLYLGVFYDNAGLSAKAFFGGAVGGGEALGAELITGWTNSPSLPYDTLTVNVNGHDIDSIINTTTYGIGYTNQNASAGQLHKIVADITLNSGTAPRLRAGSSGSVSTYIKDGLTDGTYYYTFVNTENQIHLSNQGTATNFSLLISQKQITDVPATGLHLLSSKNGSTRNMFSVESGFNPNSVTRINIYRAL